MIIYMYGTSYGPNMNALPVHFIQYYCNKQPLAGHVTGSDVTRSCMGNYYVPNNHTQPTATVVTREVHGIPSLEAIQIY